MRRLTTVHFPSDLALGVLDGNAPLGALHEHDADDHGKHENEQRKRDKQAHVPKLDELEGLDQSTGDAHNDTREDNQGNTVANPLFRNLFAKRVSMVMIRNVQPGSRTTGEPPGLYMVSRPTAMPKP